MTQLQEIPSLSESLGMDPAPENHAGTPPNQDKSGTLQTAPGFLPTVISPAFSHSPVLALSPPPSLSSWF